MARHQAHHHHCSLDTATRQIRSLIAEARAEYRAAGAPYGDDDRGFCRWLLARPRLMPTAEHTTRPSLGTASLGTALTPPLPHDQSSSSASATLAHTPSEHAALSACSHKLCSVVLRFTSLTLVH